MRVSGKLLEDFIIFVVFKGYFSCFEENRLGKGKDRRREINKF